MADGDIVYARFPVDTDVNAVADVAVTVALAVLFPVAAFDILEVELVQIGGDSGVFKNVIVVVARALSQLYFLNNSFNTKQLSSFVNKPNKKLTTEDRIRRIEERLSQEESIVFIIRNLTRDIERLNRRYMIFQGRDIELEATRIYGSTAKGIYGVDVYGESDLAFSNKSVQQGADIYLEDFHDDDFEETGNTANWDTGTKELIFA